jgi:hypothetical protein
MRRTGVGKRASSCAVAAVIYVGGANVRVAVRADLHHRMRQVKKEPNIPVSSAYWGYRAADFSSAQCRNDV